jgi:hypothetical protein
VCDDVERVASMICCSHLVRFFDFVAVWLVSLFLPVALKADK